MGDGMIYLDNSATTSLCDTAKERMLEAMETFGNPSSVHKEGVAAKRLLDKARESVGRLFGMNGASSDRLIFTSCGTEANNMAIFGSVYAKKRRAGDRIITTNSEHPSIDACLQKLENEGFEVIRLQTRGGVLDFEEFRGYLNDRVILVSLMMVNNETGAIYDVAKFFSEAKKKNPDTVTHCDAIQGFLKIPFNPKRLGADMISVSAHKIHGPKGVGALYISQEIIKRRLISPHMCGGGQEGGLRSGTENVIGICGFGGACYEGYAKIRESIENMTALRDLCRTLATEAGARVNIPSGACAPHIVSITLPSIKSETMLNYLSSKNICVSAGSACSSHQRNISSSLVGFGIPEREADTTIRVSISRFNTKEDIIEFSKALSEGINTLVRIK